MTVTWLERLPTVVYIAIIATLCLWAMVENVRMWWETVSQLLAEEAEEGSP